jgi:hypothetical protein
VFGKKGLEGIFFGEAFPPGKILCLTGQRLVKAKRGIKKRPAQLLYRSLWSCPAWERGKGGAFP